MEILDQNILNTEEAHNKSTFTSSLNSKIGLSNTRNDNDVRRFYYTVGEFNILIEQNLKVENLTELLINKVPNIPTWCLGIVSIRGVIMPVINMHNYLNTKKKSTSKINYILLDHENYQPIIFLTDDLPTTINLKKYKKIKQAYNTPSWVKTQLSNGDTSIFEADHNQLLQHFTLNN